MEITLVLVSLLGCWGRPSSKVLRAFDTSRKEILISSNILVIKKKLKKNIYIPTYALHNFPYRKWMTGSFPQFVSLGLSPAEGAVKEDEAWGGVDVWQPRISPPKGFHPCSSPQNWLKKPGGVSEWSPSLGKLRISSQLSSVFAFASASLKWH